MCASLVLKVANSYLLFPLLQFPMGSEQQNSQKKPFVLIVVVIYDTVLRVIYYVQDKSVRGLLAKPYTFEKKSCYPCDSWFIVESKDVQDEGMKAHPVSQSLKSGGQPGLQRESLSYLPKAKPNKCSQVWWHVSALRTQKVEEGLSGVLGQAQLHGELETSLGYMRFYLRGRGECMEDDVKQEH